MRTRVGLCVLLAAACGDDGVGKLADAPAATDGAADASPDGPPQGMVKLTVTQRGTPVADIAVYFQNADSSVALAGVTDANGVAMATVGAGGFVTAMNPFPGARGGVQSTSFYTFAGVKPGDDLKLVEPGSSTSVSVNLVLPTVANATQYFLYSSCSSFGMDVTNGGGGSGSSGPGGQVFLDACGTGDLLVQAQDANGLLIGSILKTNVTVVDQGSIDLSGDTYAPAIDRTFRYTNMPADYFNVNVNTHTATERGLLANGFTFIGLEGSGSNTVKLDAVDPALLVIAESVFNTDRSGQHRVFDWGASSAAEYVLDGTNLFLPTYTSAPAFDVATGSLGWTSTATGTVPDLAMADVGFGRTGGMFWDWHISALYTGTTLLFPKLPTDVAIYNPTTGDQAFPNHVYTAKVPGGYDAVRAFALNAFFDLRDLVFGPTGRIVIEDYSMLDVQAKQRVRRRR